MGVQGGIKEMIRRKTRKLARILRKSLRKTPKNWDLFADCGCLKHDKWPIKVDCCGRIHWVSDGGELSVPVWTPLLQRWLLRRAYRRWVINKVVKHVW